MHFLYNLIVHISWFHLKILAFFSSKIKLFVLGRKDTFSVLEKSISKNDNVIWMHVASLGEFEQGLPIIEKIKIKNPSHKILVTFFSPSGYEVKKNTSAADIVTYLPIDTKKNAKRFIATVNPKLALFIKYEIWPNLLRELQKNNIPALLTSAVFKKEQIYFKWYGKFMRRSLSTFTHFFIQDENSKSLLHSIKLSNVTINGDTRLDRVSEILERNNSLPFMETFKKDQLCLVAGSTWPEDETILVDYINNSPKGIKYVLAPHAIKPEKIMGLASSILKKTAIFSKIDEKTLADQEVLIIDNIGMLTKIYSYANIAYVGGGFATGLHNTLEPAVFGIPVLIGPNHDGLKAEEELISQKGILSIHDTWSFGELMKKLLESPEFIKETGEINAKYISKNKGASLQIIDYIYTLL